MAWASLSPLRHLATEDVLVEALGKGVVHSVDVEEETGEDVTSHKSVERLLFVDRDMIHHGKKTLKPLNNQGRPTLS